MILKKNLCISILALLCIFTLITKGNAYQETFMTIESKDYMSVSAVSLINLYDQNEINADDMFLDKRIHVFGFIKDIGKDITGTMYITLMGGTKGYSIKDSSSFRAVQCFFEAEHLDFLKTLKKGEPLEVIGNCAGLMMNVLIKDCQPGHWLADKVKAEKEETAKKKPATQKRAKTKRKK